MEIQKVTEDRLDYICAVCLDPSIGKKERDLMQEGMNDRISWIKETMKKGLEILIAFEEPQEKVIQYKWAGKMLHSDLAIHGKVPMGLIEYIPIEFALEPVRGKNSLFINCIWILPPFWNSGVGKSLVEVFIQRANKYGGATVIAYEGDKWFGTTIKYMPSNFFEKFGFEEVDRDGSRVLLYLNLGANEQPKFIYPKIKPQINTSKTEVDVFFNNQCPWSIYMRNTIENKKWKYPGFSFNFHNTNKREIIEKFGLSRGIYINGKPILKRMASWDEIETEFVKFK